MSQDLQTIQQNKPSVLLRPMASIADILAAQEERVSLLTKILEEKVDFGIIPGTKKPSLYKAGAERLCNSFGAHPEYEVITQEVDHFQKVSINKVTAEWDSVQRKKVETTSKTEVEGVYRYVIKCNIVGHNGNVLASSIGSCSSFESKYISRPRDSENTIIKMAQKRAFVSAALNAFGLSDRFTVDVEDFQEQSEIKTEVVVETTKAKEVKKEEKLYDKNNKEHQDWLVKTLEKKGVSWEKNDDISEKMHGRTINELKNLI